MAELKKRRRRSTGRDEAGQRIVAQPEWKALAVFALLMTLAPLAFGAVDQIVQVGLLVLFAMGLALRPPELAPPARRSSLLLILLAAVLVLKEFAPAALFGSARWRTLLVETFRLELPWTHHPEPGRAFDALLAAGLAVLWLLWVRTLAAKRENRLWLAWPLAGASAVVAAVSFLIKTKDPTAIFGLRYTPGWIGFGPFPNRNHTACFFAMGVIMSCGTLIWEIARRHTAQAIVAAIFAFTSLAGMLATQSRGGVVALAAGLAIYGALCVAKFRDRRAVALTVAIGLVGVTVALAGGSTLFARFTAQSSQDSNNARVEIWQETAKMWGDAPLLGHGVSTFPSIFPLYADLKLDNEVVLHPESSWLQWLAELGLIPTLLGALAAAQWVVPRARVALASHRSFFLYTAGFATCGALLAHAAIDVPAHRWATAAFALAALGLACPRPKASPRQPAWEPPLEPSAWSRRAAVMPLAIALLWALPLLADWPAWSPLTLQRQLAAAEARNGPAEGLRRLLPCFPLNSELHHLVGLAQMRAGGTVAEWQTHFDLADRLNPGFWGLPIIQARACARRSPEAAFHFYQLAIERANARMVQIFNLAYEETARLPGAHEHWADFVKTHPALALEYVTRVPREEALPIFARWWQERGADREAALSDEETQSYYRLAPTFATADDFALFMQAHPALAVRDFLLCARVLHAYGDDTRAWLLLSTRLHDPPLLPGQPGVPRSELERRLSVSPDSGACAQALASQCLSEGDEAAATATLLAFAQRSAAPAFFTRKAAYILKAKGEVKEAVEMMLREAP